MAEVDYSKLTNREIDALVAERVMGWTDLVPNPYGKGTGPLGFPPRNEGYRILVPHYSTDDNAIRLVRNRIAELGYPMQTAFMEQLFALTPLNVRDPFDMMQATPRQQCEAALRALDGRTK